jgi:uncharacterized SAM-binding protein YcdF (DUF218 family)
MSILIWVLAALMVPYALFHALRKPIGLVCLLAFWALGSGWLAAPLLDLAQMSARDLAVPRFQRRTALIMLGAGTRHDDAGTLIPKPDAYAHITKTAQLYRECVDAQRHCTVIVSGGNPEHNELAEADVYLPYLLQLGVPRSDIVLENASLTTYENAKYVAAILRRRQYDTTILVTSAAHMRRALFDFQRFGLTPQPAISNAHHVERSIVPLLFNVTQADLALHELVGIAQFYVYRELGWF